MYKMIKNNSFQGHPLRQALYIKRTAIAMGIVSALSFSNAMAVPTVWTQPVTGGEVLFYDWGYTGPQGQTAGEWVSNGTFDGAAQIQHVVTVDADRLTPDVTNTIQTDLDTVPLFYDANMDTQTNFYKWGYTTVGGSTFNNMQIDADGDYLVNRNDMTFMYYNTFDYQYDGGGDLAALPQSATEGIHTTNIAFQPYALSDATGWCGSVGATNPAALEAMAGQVTFDFGFEAYLPTNPNVDGDGIGIPGAGSMQIVQDFEMRSYGSLEINITIADGGSGDFNFTADAVVNNTDPTAATDTGAMIEVPILNMDGTQALDDFGQPRTMMVEDKAVGGGGINETYYNTVSFMGGGVVPDGVWVKLIDPGASASDANIIEVLDADDGQADTVWHVNSFAGYPFLLRADGIRILDAMDFSLYSDLSGVPASSFDGSSNLLNLEGGIVADLSISPVPVPAAVWLFGSGLLGLIGVSRRRKI